MNLADYCEEKRRRDLLEQWSSRNGKLNPGESIDLTKKVWWVCPKGHEYEQMVSSRLYRGAGCPYCSGAKILVGYNDLESLRPDLAAEWDWKKNTRKPSEVTPGSKRKVWWICPKGHEYAATSYSRSHLNTGCPFCSNRRILPEENSLAALFPQIAAEWHPKKNGKKTPETISVGSNRKVWWRCPLGHEWLSQVYSRTAKKTGCPYCTNKKVLVGFNDLATTHPKVAEQWHPQLNGSRTPQMFTFGSNTMAWWICEKGHVWKTTISSRAGKKKSGCPVCSGYYKQARNQYYENMLRELNNVR